MAIDRSILADLERGVNDVLLKKQPYTLPNVMAVLEYMGYAVRYNLMVGRWEISGGGVGPDEAAQDLALHMIEDNLTRVGIAPGGRVPESLGTLAQAERYHPMEDWLDSLPRGEGDAIGALAATVTTDNELWPILLRKWLVQVVDAVCGWRDREGAFSLPYCLVLVGGQGVGKTRWLANLGGPFIRTEAELHLNSVSGKDHQIEVLRLPMAELSELDGIFRKSDIQHLKSFLSRGEDAIREPYARKARTRGRMTVFCGSVNEAEFLNDTSGNRRFWPVSVDSIVWDHGVDFEAVWAQAHELWLEGEDFNLDAETSAAMDGVSSSQHTSTPVEVEKIMEYYRRHHGNKRYPDVPMNRSEILEMLWPGRPFGNKAVSDIGKFLIARIGKHKTIDDKQRAWPFPYNEFAHDQRTWPDKRHLEIV